MTEAAPWPSLVQRAGRCNRTGKVADAELWWLPPAKPLPYEQQDVDATAAELARLEGERRHRRGPAAARRAHDAGRRWLCIRRSDFVGLFDTAPDLSGADVDIAPYVRDADDLDAEIAWGTWTPGADGAPGPGCQGAAGEYRCRVSLGDCRKLAKDRAVWRLDQVAGRWARVTARPAAATAGRGAAGQRRRRRL